MEKITLMIIFRNEERCIERCISSIPSYFDEIVLLDTGSNDRTLELVKRITKYNNKVKLYYYTWNDDFSAARNYLLNKIDIGWVFYIDADEVICRNQKNLKSLCHDLDKNIIYTVQLENEDGRKIAGLPRLFYNDTRFCFWGKVHEELRYRENGVFVKKNKKSIPYCLWHDGYSRSVFSQKNKGEYYSRLLKKNIELEPDNARWRFLFLRDSFEEIDYEEFKRIFYKAFLKDDARGLLLDNVIEDEYLFPAVSLFIEKSMMCSDCEKEIDDLIAISQKLFPNNYDAVYFEFLKEISRIRLDECNLLKRIMRYRKEYDEIQYGTIHSGGAYIDLEIAYLLYRVGHIKLSQKYFYRLKELNGSVLYDDVMYDVDEIKRFF